MTYKIMNLELPPKMTYHHTARKEALATGNKTYIGRSCSKGHNGLRYVVSSVCVTCAKLNYKPTGRKAGSEALPERQAAIDKREIFYFTGKPCKHGHVSKRYVKGCVCFECSETVFKLRRQSKERQYSLAKYGITPEQYDAMFLAQSGLCAICKNPEVNIDHNTKEIRALAVDHCHDTERVRKLLCSSCNMGIGSFKHSSELLRSAALYCEEA